MRARDVHNGRGEQNTRGPSVTEPLKGASTVLRFNGLAASLFEFIWLALDVHVPVAICSVPSLGPSLCSFVGFSLLSASCGEDRNCIVGTRNQKFRR